MLAALAIALATSSCFGPRADAFALQAGDGDHVSVTGIGWEVPFSDGCNDSSRLHGGLLYRIDGWRGKDRGGRNLLNASVTPFLRCEVARPLGTPIYLEGGVGANLLSRTRVDEWRQFSTAFQFGEFVGLTVRSSKSRQFGVRVQHVSNGGIKQPNDGLTYGMLFFNYRF